ncbi:hypothetical protein NEOLEDRAFT_1135976 [Neolentinus lepideus HHB14362 ss-1]|uniref:Uncharacterized protein n=1 Tax=Neolentinus lepideus HHB14362 ss-1 TaxID=1314782 RepID=A0A165RHN2_9AGAM|nr:hypothetical protein NEOLEDRAFT_1135976 [Neolentinus lepideus HHB14362 ss-1]
MSIPRSKLTVLALCCLAVAKAFLIVLVSHARDRYSSRLNSPYNFLGDDYPRLWEIDGLRPIRMFQEDTVHYQMDDPVADIEWDALAPGRGLIYFGEDHAPFTISMFHQLRCVNVIRGELVRRHSEDDFDSTPPYLVQHCLNYIRQVFLCNIDIRLDMVLGPVGYVYPHPYTCRDWNVVYQEVEKNHRMHSEWLSNRERNLTATA